MQYGSRPPMAGGLVSPIGHAFSALRTSAVRSLAAWLAPSDPRRWRGIEAGGRDAAELRKIRFGLDGTPEDSYHAGQVLARSRTISTGIGVASRVASGPQASLGTGAPSYIGGRNPSCIMIPAASGWLRNSTIFPSRIKAM